MKHQLKLKALKGSTFVIGPTSNGPKNCSTFQFMAFCDLFSFSFDLGSKIGIAIRSMGYLPRNEQDHTTDQPSNAFQLFWAVSGLILVTCFWWVRDMALVIWVLGREAYFRDGVRVLPGKPTLFSTGEPAPEVPDIVTGLLYFVIVMMGWTALLFLGRRAYKHFRKNERIS